MAKTRARAVPRPRAAHAEPERWTRLLIVGGIVAVVVLAIGIIAFGWYQTQIAPKGKTILRVGDISVSLGHLERRMNVTLQENTFLQQPDVLRAPEGFNLLIQFVNQTFSDLEREAKLLEAAHQLNNIAVTQEEIDQEIRERGSLTTDVSPEAFAQEFKKQVEDSGLNQDEYLQMLKAELLEKKVRDYFTFVAPTKETQVRARWIVLQEETQANQALERLNNGDDFATVARELSTDETTRDAGGELGWRPRGGFVGADEVETFLFDEAQPGERSEVLETDFGQFFIVELLERAEDRPLDDTQRQSVIEREFNKWLEGLDDDLNVRRDFTAEDAGRVVNDLF